VSRASREQTLLHRKHPGKRIMSHSLLTAGAGTHCKIAIVSTVAIALLLAVGVCNRMDTTHAAARVAAGGPPVKAVVAPAHARGDAALVR
jgi:hypothetical protein